ncbi:MAG: hypothetical protein VZR54_08800 [Ruminococcus sp.]|nr:hypothetical protein [Ruminococcus sp.]
MSDYMLLLDAVKNYYGAGSDQWVEIAKYGINSENAYSILSQTPNVSTVVSESGDVLGYTVKEVSGIASQPASAIIDSNTQLATMTEVATVNYPAQMSVSQTGEIVATTGTKAVSTGTKVASAAGKVLAVVGAVAAGVQLGAVIDSVLYNANPDFWDENGMSSLNPQTWDSICTTENGKKCFNMIFGISEDTTATQPYLDERALAYIAQYMSNKGAFSSPETVVTEYDPTTTYKLSYTYTYPITLYSECHAIKKSTGEIAFPYEVISGNACIVVITQNNTQYMLMALGETGSIVSADHQTYTLDNRITIDGVSYGYVCTALANTYKVEYNYTKTSASLYGDFYIFRDLVHLIYKNNGVHTSKPVEGITAQTDATLPTGITPSMSIDDVITYLKSVYPSLWSDAITNDVIQPDGTLKQFTYVPVGMPDTIPNNPGYGLQPTGGVGTLQSDSTIDDTSPDDVTDTLIKIMGTPSPDNPSIPQNPTDVPDTGSGVTPPIVTPSGSAGALYAVYNPTQSQINSFGSWLWSSNFVEQIKKLFNDPMQSIIGLHKIFATPSTGASQNIMVGYIDSGVSSATVSNQYATVDCGAVDLYEYFGNALDYTHTDIYLYLPFVGIVPLNVLDVTRATIGIIYKVDVLTGACLVSVNVNRDGGAGGQLYTYSGNCAVQYPLSSGSYIGIVTSILGVAGGIAGTIASGGAMLPVALGAGASALGGAKTNVEHSGNLSGNAGAMGIKKPYLIIKRPQTDFADNFEIYDGRSINEHVTVSTLSGFVRAKYVNLENIDPATGDELSEIETLLLNGVLI